ncbi:YceI family protein [Limibacter armeniacum]|uniref:YceI family protein n=1 Tax=Limibacter armeniacum TaxID=466084 RepID=UPI002FE55787
MSTTSNVKTLWSIDPVHSEIFFKVKHMMVSTVTGAFNEFKGSVEAQADDFENAEISFEADINSIDTKNEQRDGHLKSADFFDAENFPTLKFKSTAFHKKADGSYELFGNLTIKDVTKEVLLEVEYNGRAVDPYGQEKAGFEIIGKISRKEYDLKWNALTEAGSVVVSDEVRLALNVQLVLG